MPRAILKGFAQHLQMAQVTAPGANRGKAGRPGGPDRVKHAHGPLTHRQADTGHFVANFRTAVVPLRQADHAN